MVLQKQKSTSTNNKQCWWGTYVDSQGQPRYIFLKGEKYVYPESVHISMAGWSGVPTDPTLLRVSRTPPSEPLQLNDKRYEEIRLCGFSPDRNRLELIGPGSCGGSDVQYTAMYSDPHDVVRLLRTPQGTSPPVPDAALTPYFSPETTRTAFDKLPLAWQALLRKKKCVPSSVVEVCCPQKARDLLLDLAVAQGIKPQVRTVFHGTAPDAARSIVEYGFAPISPINGKAFGKGVYFSTDPKYAAQTIYRRFGSDGTRVLLVCQILEGTNTKTTSSTSSLAHATTGGNGKQIRLVFWPNVVRGHIIITHMLFYGDYDACAYARMCLDAGLYLGQDHGNARIMDITSDEIVLSNGQTTTLHEMWLQRYTSANLEQLMRRTLYTFLLPDYQKCTFVPGQLIKSEKSGRKILLIEQLLSDGSVVIARPRTRTRLTRQEFMDAVPLPYTGRTAAWWWQHLQPGFVVLHKKLVATVMAMSKTRVFLTYRFFHPDGKKQESPALLPFDGLDKRSDEWVDKNQCQALGRGLDTFLRQRAASPPTPAAPHKKKRAAKKRAAAQPHTAAAKKLKL